LFGAFDVVASPDLRTARHIGTFHHAGNLTGSVPPFAPVIKVPSFFSHAWSLITNLFPPKIEQFNHSLRMVSVFDLLILNDLIMRSTAMNTSSTIALNPPQTIAVGISMSHASLDHVNWAVHCHKYTRLNDTVTAEMENNSNRTNDLTLELPFSAAFASEATRVES
jgi:hypothetical protein